MKKDLQNLRESYEKNVLRENVDRLEFLKNKFLPLFYNKLLHVWPDESRMPSDYEAFKPKIETNSAYKKYAEFLSETIDNLISADPYSKVDIEKGAGYAGQYSEWILKTFLKTFDEKGEGAGKTINHVRRFLNEDLYKLNSDLKIYDKNKGKVSLNKKNVRDINQIPDFSTLYYIIKDFIPKYEEEGVKDKTKVRTLLDNSQYFVGVPLTLSASQNLGNNTRWCTAARSEDNQYFQNYTKDGPLYVVFIKAKSGLIKFQFHFPSGQYMDSDDRPINVFKFFSEHPAVGQVILDDYKTTEPKEENLRKAELLTGGLGILEKEPDQFFQNISISNIVTMIVRGQADLDKINKALQILSDAFDHAAEFDDEGLQIYFKKSEYNELMDQITGGYQNNVVTVAQNFINNPLSVFFDDNQEEQMVPYVLENILKPEQVKNIRRVYDDIAETPETSDEFYAICKDIMHKNLQKCATQYKKNVMDEIFTKRRIAIGKKGKKTAIMIPYDALLDVFDEKDDTTFFNLLENPSYYIKLQELFPEVDEDQTEEEKINFINYISQNIDKNKIASEIIQKVDKK